MTPSVQAAALRAPPRPAGAAAVRVHAPELPRGTVRSGLRSDEGIEAMEQLMHLLAGGDAGDRAGRMVVEHLATGGKRLRARLAFAAMEVMGVRRGAGVGWAAACELLHNATLVHDDLQDGDPVRRGAPTTWVRHGAAQAVNAGDLLLMLPFLAIDRLAATAEERMALTVALAEQATHTVRGQAAELALAAAPALRWDDYLAAVRGKTGALFQLPVEGAALLAGHDRAGARTIGAAFLGVGVLFQLQDDVLDLFGEKGRGAPGSDLREGKVSALVVEHLALHPAEGPALRALLALPRDATPAEEVQRTTERFRSGGALERVLARINREAWDVMSAPGLARAPALRALAWELVCVALDPIRHLGGPGEIPVVDEEQR
jgi:geranylgeranyl diphosphate synthase, type I